MEPEPPVVGVLPVDGVREHILGGPEASSATDDDNPVVAEPESNFGVEDASKAAFVDFYRAKRDVVARALGLTLGDGSLGAEGADEAMARAYQRWARVGSFDDPAGWVYRVGLNWATSVIRRRRHTPQPRVDRVEADVAVSEPTVLAALAALDLRQRSVIVCRFYLGLSEAETATALGIRPGTVKSRLHRGLANLQPRLAHLSPEEI